MVKRRNSQLEQPPILDSVATIILQVFLNNCEYYTKRSKEKKRTICAKTSYVNRVLNYKINSDRQTRNLKKFILEMKNVSEGFKE